MIVARLVLDRPAFDTEGPMASREHAAALALFCIMAVSAPAVGQSVPQPVSEFITEFVVANRILADQGIIADGFGHLSARSPSDPNRFYMSRARAAGMVTDEDVLEFDLRGQPLDQRGRKLFSERYIHAEIYKARPEVNAVVHSHASALLPFGLTGTPLRPVAHMAGFLLRAAPLFEIREAGGEETSMLVNTPELGVALAKTLGQAPIVLMRGHGFNTVGTSVKQAVSRAIYAEINARILLEALKLGNVVYLNESEAAKIAEVIDASVGRSWEIWKFKALASTPKF
jgi:ribulose-5-phosphate 4-epimerase/fuculose-1-phosphate aldolase